MDNLKDLRETATNGIMLLVFGLILLVAGCWTGWGLHSFWSSWPRLDAEVMSGSVEEFSSYPSARGAMPLRQYRPRIELRYHANGHDYTTELSLDRPADTSAKAQEALRSAYAPGTHHAIRYNPKSPTDIRLAGMDSGDLVLSLILLAMGVVLCTSSAGGLWIVHSKVGVRRALSFREAAEAPGGVVEFPARPSAASEAGPTLRCPSCGETVAAGQDICPKCWKSLHAA